MSLSDVFTGRALMNVEKIMDCIDSFSQPLKRALLLTLTSASGQMSNMVFAIENRGGNGKRNGARIEVGSWVIGYWIPKTHFEINVWNCFKNRANKLLKILPNAQKDFRFSTNPTDTQLDFSDDAILINRDCRLALKTLADNSVSLICTDPPHSDRVPYLELSEMWNSILGYSPDFSNEIVVSNAKERKKTKSVYNEDMMEFFAQSIRVLKNEGYVAIFFNARDEESWQYLKAIETTSTELNFMGCFPMAYSATSVVQDNRKGAMRSDYVLLYQKNTNRARSLKNFPSEILTIPGWSEQFPDNRS
jgi:hypothetical protein